MLVAKRTKLVEAVQFTSELCDAIEQALREGVDFDDELNVPDWLAFLVFGCRRLVCEDGMFFLIDEEANITKMLWEGDWLVKKEGILPAVYSASVFRAKYVAVEVKGTSSAPF